MLINYIKITLAVMRRRKFFTFISMFGISFTLLILILITSFLEHMLGPNYPEWNRNKMAYIMMVEQKSSEKGWSNTGPMSFSYAKRYVKTLKTPEKVALSSIPSTINAYSNGQKFRLFYRYTDAEFWEVTQFNFLEGRPYTQEDIDQNAMVIVINDRMRDNYYGKNASAIGKIIEIENVNYRVIGVVQGVPVIRLHTTSDVWMPYNAMKSDLSDPGYSGPFSALLQPKAGESAEPIKAEYAEVVSRIPPQDPELDKITSIADGFVESISRNIFGSRDDSGLRMMFLLLSAFALLFMLIPALNLINLNISRIMERASEIGVRRASGASARHLVLQFTIENVLIAVIGGIVALVLATLIIWLFNQSDLYAYADLRINWRVALVAFVCSIVFGLISGVYPAWRMSKLAPVEALKA
jgi:putative ABC transport system permease protein